MRVALLGCGTVGTALVEMVADPAAAAEIELNSGVRLEIVGIAVRDARCVPRQRTDGSRATC